MAYRLSISHRKWLQGIVHRGPVSLPIIQKRKLWESAGGKNTRFLLFAPRRRSRMGVPFRPQDHAHFCQTNNQATRDGDAGREATVRHWNHALAHFGVRKRTYSLPKIQVIIKKNKMFVKCDFTVSKSSTDNEKVSNKANKRKSRENSCNRKKSKAPSVSSSPPGMAQIL